jgi:hypothetical protein
VGDDVLIISDSSGDTPDSDVGGLLELALLER